MNKINTNKTYEIKVGFEISPKVYKPSGKLQLPSIVFSFSCFGLEISVSHAILKWPPLNSPHKHKHTHTHREREIQVMRCNAFSKVVYFCVAPAALPRLLDFFGNVG